MVNFLSNSPVPTPAILTMLHFEPSLPSPRKENIFGFPPARYRAVSLIHCLSLSLSLFLSGF